MYGGGENEEIGRLKERGNGEMSGDIGRGRKKRCLCGTLYNKKKEKYLLWVWFWNMEGSKESE